ncbi:MAG: T9SS type A sorting domain-containing protein [Bacteroidetes bacterium]|nr:T9SS type A sorting domain-containing protein [Bacteroidota bacterium]
MTKILLTLSSLFILQATFAQPGIAGPQNADAVVPEWGYTTKSAGDSCGAYFNNYIGLAKTTSVLQEYMRTGDVVDDFYYAGRAQRFTVSQPVDVSGVEFYAYETSPLDSVMVITSLHTYLPGPDSLGPEITRDTVYVKHTSFSLILPNIAVQSYFDVPVTMNSDYIIAMHSTQNEELVIVTNDYTANDGNGESFSFALYQNPDYPTFDEWVSAMSYFAADYDYLMNPLVKYDLFDPFTILDDTICPDAVNAGCVSYTQTGNFTNHLYNSNYASATTHNRWLWGDGYQNVDLTSACHTYANAGTFNIELQDTLFRYDFNSPYCVVDVTQPIVALDVPVPAFTFTQNGLTADFTNTSTNADSAWWNFGDATAGTDLDNPSHAYATVGTFNVWLYAYNECYVDSTMLTVTTDDVGIAAHETELVFYPNPANTQVVISGLQGESKIEILNILGEVVAVIRTSDSQETISVAHLPTGTYFVKISQNNQQLTKKLVVKHS